MITDMVNSISGTTNTSKLTAPAATTNVADAVTTTIVTVAYD